MSTETPKYEVLERHGDIEVRRYEPMIIADVTVNGVRREASSQGFRLLADYIFGNNRINEDIAMTAPVQQRASEKIAMTAPVQQVSEEADEWQISFVMPSKYSMASLPTPNNDRVILREIPSQTFIVIRFSGRSSDDNVQEHETQLANHIKENKIRVSETPKYAFYSPPWTLPALRRNEVMFELLE